MWCVAPLSTTKGIDSLNLTVVGRVGGWLRAVQVRETTAGSVTGRDCEELEISLILSLRTTLTLLARERTSSSSAGVTSWTRRAAGVGVGGLGPAVPVVVGRTGVGGLRTEGTGVVDRGASVRRTDAEEGNSSITPTTSGDVQQQQH